MPDQAKAIDLLQAARSEDLVDDQVKQLAVIGSFEREIISTLEKVVHTCSKEHAGSESPCCSVPQNWKRMPSLGIRRISLYT